MEPTETPTTPPNALVRVAGLCKSFGGGGWPKRRPVVQAADDVSFHLDRGETLALVGESGAGKSTTGRLLLRLIEPDAGSIHLNGIDVSSLAGRELRRFRRRAQMVFQDPYSSFDPRVPVLDSVMEPLVVHQIGTENERRERVGDLLGRVGLGTHLSERYPSQLSGGQLQRAAIARALTTDPELIVCDEAVSALDVSTQAQVIDLLSELQAERKLSYLFITHDLALVGAFADRIVVMRHGAVVEEGTTDDIFDRATESYTRTLLDAVPYVA